MTEYANALPTASPVQGSSTRASVARRAVAGLLHARSSCRDPGAGTAPPAVMTVLVPGRFEVAGREDDSSDKGAAIVSASMKPRSERLRVVIVEDEGIIALELEEMLLQLGIEVVGFAGAADEAVELAASERPDFITMDVHLHGERDGISAAIEIFERFGIRSVFVSAYGDPDTMARAQAAHPLDWIPKPVRYRELDAALRDLFPGPQSS